MGSITEEKLIKSNEIKKIILSNTTPVWNVISDNGYFVDIIPVDNDEDNDLINSHILKNNIIVEIIEREVQISEEKPTIEQLENRIKILEEKINKSGTTK